MTVVKTAKYTDEYAGLSGDTKPTTGVGEGYRFTEIDTGARFIWHNGAWEEDLTWIYAIQQGTL